MKNLRLRAARAAKGLSQQALAELAGGPHQLRQCLLAEPLEIGRAHV